VRRHGLRCSAYSQSQFCLDLSRCGGLGEQPAAIRANVRFGSGTDIAAPPHDVRGHKRTSLGTVGFTEFPIDLRADQRDLGRLTKKCHSAAKRSRNDVTAEMRQ
jgi:hypothetical protein